jgi:hypothetical protein
MSEHEYLIGYGLAGEFGRFRSALPLTCGRGDRVVVRTHRGIEAGHVLRAAVAGHARFLPNTTVGQLLRTFNSADVRAELSLRDRAPSIWSRAAQLAEELGLLIELLDVEILLDGEHAVLHHLRSGDCDLRPLVSTLAREFDIHVLLVDLANQANPETVDDELDTDHGCGSCSSEGGCSSGKCSEGGCGSCGSGGCSSQAAAGATSVADFAALRERMEQQRTPLL